MPKARVKPIGTGCRVSLLPSQSEMRIAGGIRVPQRLEYGAVCKDRLVFKCFDDAEIHNSNSIHSAWFDYVVRALLFSGNCRRLIGATGSTLNGLSTDSKRLLSTNNERCRAPLAWLRRAREDRLSHDFSRLAEIGRSRRQSNEPPVAFSPPCQVVCAVSLTDSC